MKIEIKGHIATWIVKKVKDGFNVYAKGEGEQQSKIHTYKTKEQVLKAIHIAEERYLQKYPNAKLVNEDIWATHGVLWVQDIDGNYYNF